VHAPALSKPTLLLRHSLISISILVALLDLPSRLRSLEADHSRISDLAEELRVALRAEKEEMKKLRSDLATLSQLDVSSSFVPLTCPPGVGVDSISQRRPV